MARFWSLCNLLANSLFTPSHTRQQQSKCGSIRALYSTLAVSTQIYYISLWSAPIPEKIVLAISLTCLHHDKYLSMWILIVPSSWYHQAYIRGMAVVRQLCKSLIYSNFKKKKAEEKEKVFKPRPQGNVGCFKSVFCCQTITPLNCSLIFIRHLYRTILIILVFKKAQGKTTFPSKCLLA